MKFREGFGTCGLVAVEAKGDADVFGRSGKCMERATVEFVGTANGDDAGDTRVSGALDDGRGVVGGGEVGVGVRKKG